LERIGEEEDLDRLLNIYLTDVKKPASLIKAMRVLDKKYYGQVELMDIEDQSLYDQIFTKRSLPLDFEIQSNEKRDFIIMPSSGVS